jgi:methionyl-tRNA synthetase
MENITLEASLLIWLIPLAIWDMIWKGIALWKAGKNSQLNWFIAIFILNTAGILPIIYIKFFQKNNIK